MERAEQLSLPVGLLLRDLPQWWYSLGAFWPPAVGQGEQTGLDYNDAVHWNVIPWWAQDPSRGAPDRKPRTLKSQSLRASPYLAELLDLLPSVSKVVLLGNEARDAWAAATMAPGSRLRPVHVQCCPHPSPRAFNRPENKSCVLETLRWAAHDE